MHNIFLTKVLVGKHKNICVVGDADRVFMAGVVLIFKIF